MRATFAGVRLRRPGMSWTFHPQGNLCPVLHSSPWDWSGLDNIAALINQSFDTGGPTNCELRQDIAISGGLVRLWTGFPFYNPAGCPCNDPDCGSLICEAPFQECPGNIVPQTVYQIDTLSVLAQITEVPPQGFPPGGSYARVSAWASGLQIFPTQPVPSTHRINLFSFASEPLDEDLYTDTAFNVDNELLDERTRPLAGGCLAACWNTWPATNITSPCGVASTFCPLFPSTEPGGQHGFEGTAFVELLPP